jgi:membrane-bound lytic murein transglycosylase B
MRKKRLIAVIILLYAAVATPQLKAAEPEKFQTWLGELRIQAIRQGISQGTVDRSLSHANYLPEVMDLYRNQPEFKWTLNEYLDRVASEDRIALGKQKLNEYRTLLEDVYSRYQVEPRFIVALWGIESNFGQISGGFPVIDSLATLAYASSRKDFYRQELFDALRILDQGQISLDKMRGSWAGAMGQLQFMPSTFQNFAVDYDGDGKIDIWNDVGDAFVSAANYLRRSGWIKDQTWGLEVTLPSELKRNMPGRNTQKLLSEWKAAGVKGVGDHDLAVNPDYPASLIEPDPRVSRDFLIFENYKVILKWNRSDFFAIAAGMLADGIGDQETRQRGPSAGSGQAE